MTPSAAWPAAAVLLGVALLWAPGRGQEILQAVVLDLTVVEVQVIVAATRGDERLQCLVRGAADRVRVAVERPIAAGFTSGRTTVVSLPLPLLEAGDLPAAVSYAVRSWAVSERLPIFPQSVHDFGSCIGQCAK